MSLDVYLTVDTCPMCGHAGDGYSANITHNLGQMAEAAGCYDVVWHPEDHGITKAGQLVEPLTAAIDRLLADSRRFKAFNPENGWGDYDGLLDFLCEYRDACARLPEAKVSVSR